MQYYCPLQDRLIIIIYCEYWSFLAWLLVQWHFLKVIICYIWNLNVFKCCRQDGQNKTFYFNWIFINAVLVVLIKENVSKKISLKDHLKIKNKSIGEWTEGPVALHSALMVIVFHWKSQTILYFLLHRYFLASFYTKYDTTHFVVNTVSLLSVLIPKLPQLHGVRIFGINKY